MHLVLQALLREPRAEGATRVPPPAMGRLPGLDRAPEVKTIRRKLGELAATGKAADLQMAIARHRAAARPEELAFMYIDGHTRAYFGTRDVQKMHVAPLKFPGPATEETWVTDGAGDPLLVVMAEPSASLAAQIKELLPKLRQIAGEDAQAHAVLRPRRLVPGPVRRHHPRPVPPAHLPEGQPRQGYPQPARRPVQRGQPHRRRRPGSRVRAGRVRRRAGHHQRRAQRGNAPAAASHPRAKGRQVHILTDREPGDLPGGEVIYRMGSRWREENYFRYGREHFALDALDSYAVTPGDPDRKVPNPARKTAHPAVEIEPAEPLDLQAHVPADNVSQCDRTLRHGHPPNHAYGQEDEPARTITPAEPPTSMV